MNESGQLLIYDLIFGVIILLMIIILSMYIFEENSHYYMNMQDSEKPLDILNTLSDTPYEDGYLLEILSRELDNNNTNNDTLHFVNEIISSNTHYEYTFSDDSSEVILIDTRSSHYREVFSGRKIINKLVFVLKYYEK